MWLNKNKAVKSPDLLMDPPLKSLLKANMKTRELERINQSHIQSAKNPQKLFQIKKVIKVLNEQICNNNDLILNGENILDNNEQEKDTEQRKKPKSVKSSSEAFGKKRTVGNALSPLLSINLANQKMDLSKVPLKSKIYARTPIRKKRKLGFNLW